MKLQMPRPLTLSLLTATVVLVVAFLCGVLTGRGAKPERANVAETTAAAVAVTDPVPTPAAQPAAPPAQPPTEAPAPADELSYFERLQKNDTPSETLKASSSASNAASPAARPARAAPPQPLPADPRPAAASTDEPTGPGFAVQVSVFPDRRTADTMAKRLIGKGYRAYGTGPVNAGSRTLYRVRVGKFKDRHEADAVAHRLATEEQYTPWITR